MGFCPGSTFTLDPRTPDSQLPRHVHVHLHMFRQFCAESLRKMIWRSLAAPDTPSIRDFYERNVVEVLPRPVEVPFALPFAAIFPWKQKLFCACATKASFNAHLACRHCRADWLLFYLMFLLDFFWLCLFLADFWWIYFLFAFFAIILSAAATEVALDASPRAQRLSVICPRRGVVILRFLVLRFSSSVCSLSLCKLVQVQARIIIFFFLHFSQIG